ncbi:restriction endonuclease subunit S [Bacteroides ovatus]|uniref:restriction endonuclease subunit S n=1 Tax=Bacteroides ovatus TaxID=28116 RepID=UPI00232C1BEA|nr:restriction endonuclease subunit S [Bacteroides ovatus]MDC2571539.1 restriction endonuclease subunit S [Bacteroides ovatus]MDC2575576.1 restriction endonuclease subunit S [Bacteroides ovatus]MDC2590732.1 restriction endonuclease subunit S [Bacteroides ovatus]MDC2600960.1 restriction endonuclease subunit S [Bacteroides ovatus]
MLATGEVKCIDEEVAFDIPQGWEWTRIGNIFNHTSGKQQSSSNKGGGTPQKFITTSNLYWGHFILDNVKVMNFTDEEIKTCSATKGDLLVCEGGAGYGRSAIWNEDYDICLQNHVHRLRPCVSGICEYVYHFIYLLKESNNLASVGTAMPGLSANRLKGFLLPFPPLSEQRRIVAKLAELLPQIEKYNNVQNKLDELNTTIKDCLKKSILQEAIQGKLVPQLAEEGTAQELLEQIKTEKQKLVKEGKLKKSALKDSVIFKGDDNKYWEKSTECMECIDDKIPFEIPSTWCWVRHNQLFEISGGSQPPKSQFVDSPKSGYIRLYQIRDYGSNPMPVYIPQEKANKITKEGDIILARYGGSLGKVFWAKDGAYNVAMAKVIPLFDSEFVNKQYLFLFYQSSIYQYLVKDHSRSAQAGFNKDDLKDLFFPLPPLEEQSRIVEIYKSVTSIMS